MEQRLVTVIKCSNLYSVQGKFPILLEENAEVVKFFCHTLLSFKPSDTENEWAANLHLCVD